MKKVKIVLVACCEYGYNIYNRMINEKTIKVDYLVTLSPSQAKLNHVSGYYNYKKFSQNHKIPIYYPESYKLDTEKDINFFKSNNFDLMFMGGWQRLIPETVLKLFKIGSLGFHGSSELLPKGKGRSPINWSIIEGKKKFILHLFFLDKDVDNGDIIDILEFDINEFDTCKSLYYKVAIAGRNLIQKNIVSIISKTYTSKPQIGQSSYYPKRSPKDGLINWEEKDVYEIYNLIRGITKPYPGAFTYLGGQEFKIWKAVVFDTKLTFKKALIGQVVEVFSDNSFLINCKKGSLLVDSFDGPKVKLGDVLKKTETNK